MRWPWSLPRPRFVQDLILNDHDPFSPALDAAVAYAVALQATTGLDIISDGEWRRKSYLGAIANVVTGLTHYFKDGRSWHTVTQRLQHQSPGWFAKEAAWLKKHTDKKIKVCLPSPYLLGQRLWDQALSHDAYQTRESFAEALVPILKQEAQLLAQAGADIIQIDDPHICLFVDEQVRAGFADLEAELKRACGLVHEVVKDVRGAETALHLCRRNKGRAGWIGEGGYEPIIPAISTIGVTQFVLEYSIPVAGDLRALADLPIKYQVGLGCVDCRFERIETPEEIAARVEKALESLWPRNESY